MMNGLMQSLAYCALGDVTVSHSAISFFSEKILTSCCKAACFPSPIYLIDVSCAGFSKDFPTSANAFVVASAVEIKGILVDCGNFLIVSADCYDLVFGVYNLYVQYPFIKVPM